MLTTFRFLLFFLCQGIIVPVSTFREYVICITNRRLQNRQNITCFFFLQTLVNINDQCNPWVMKKKISVNASLLFTQVACKI